MIESLNDEVSPALILDATQAAEVADTLQALQSARSLSRVLRQALQSSPLSQEMWLILEALENEPQRLTEIAQHVGALKGSVSRWLATLHRLGLVTQQFSANDRRDKILSLSPEGLRELQIARRLIVVAGPQTSSARRALEDSAVSGSATQDTAEEYHS